MVLEEARLIRSWNLALRLNSQNYNSWMVTYNPLHGHPQFQGWSPTFPKMVTHFQKDGHQPSPGWSPTILSRVPHHLKFGHPPTQGRSPTIISTVTHCPKDMVTHHPQAGHPQTVEWLPIFPRMAFALPSTSHQSSPGWSDTIKRYGHTPSPGWSPTKRKMVNHRPQDGYHFS